jgi:hypothetical protein
MADAVNMKTKGAKIYAAVTMRNAQMKISRIKDWVDLPSFLLLGTFATARPPVSFQ